MREGRGEKQRRAENDRGGRSEKEEMDRGREKRKKCEITRERQRACAAVGGERGGSILMGCRLLHL